jgi:excinuclease ABC subunit A
MSPKCQSNGLIRVRGAREHKLKNVNVEIPRDAVVVFTGVSGSG